MCEQIEIQSFKPTEALLFDSMQEKLTDTVSRCGVPVDLLTIREPENTSGYYSVKYAGNLAFTIKAYKKDNKTRITFPAEMGNFISKDIEKKQSDDKIAIQIQYGKYDIESINTMCCKAVEIAINRLPIDFDCCSRYNLCSDEKRCIHPDGHFSIGCRYRRTLQKGIVFFGANRNIP